MWKVRPPTPVLSSIIARKLGISSIIAQILINRGIHTIEQGRCFLGGELDRLHRPLLFKDMGRAVERILKAARTGERILVYGDYDTDGITAAALLSKVLQRLGADAACFIPNRLVEGYGLDLAVLQKELGKGTSLVITVDCGISDLAEVCWAQENGIDLVITDHHEPPEAIPPAFAVINPKCVDSGYPYKELAGAGVALKLGQALLEAAGHGGEAWRDYLDLACLGTIADIVPIQGENRILVKHGLPALAGSNCPGIKALIEISGIKDKDIGTREVAFGLAPRLNAAGRTGAPELALQLLLSDHYSEAVELAGRLNRANQERQRIESAVLEEALVMLDSIQGKKESSVLALASENWHPGVTGIVASRLTDRFYKPALLITVEGGEGRGSARSIPGFNIHKALAHCRDLLLDYGGHALAAGFTIKSSDIEMFFRKLEAYAQEIMRGEKLLPLLEIDGLVDIEQVSEDLINEIKLLQPFGHANPDPLLGCRGARLVESRGVGKGSAHLKMRLGGSKKVLDGIGFNLGAYAEVLATGEAVDLAFVPDINEYNGRRSVQLAVKDLGAPAVFALAEGQAGEADCLGEYCCSLDGKLDDWREDLFVPEFVFTTLQKLRDGECQGLVKPQRQEYDIQVVDCRDAGDRPLRLAELAAAGEPALVITACGYQNVELAHHIVLSTPSLRGKVGFCHYHTPADIKNKLASLFQAGEIDILLTTPAAAGTAGLCADKVLLYHLPYGPDSVGHTYNCVSPGGRLYLLYGSGDLQDNLDSLGSLAPGREYLVNLYRMLRREGKKRAVFNTNNLAKALSDAGFNHAGACTIEIALKIFVELELLTCHNEGKILNIHFMPPPAQKKDLSQAQTYQVLTQIKKDCIQLMRNLLSAPVYNLFGQGVS